jgi:uncharacterized protein YlbG (UPF0298 family)
MYQLAQLNIATVLAPMDSPQLKDFADNLDRVNSIAESSLGFVWRLQDDSGNATELQYFVDPDIIVNMSVWESVQSLKDFMFKTVHIDFLKRKKEWFFSSQSATYVLWWIEKDHIPSVEEAMVRLEYLRKNQESPYAFSFKKVFSAEQAMS